MISKLLTVVIPVFNQQKYIARCIRSILNQTLDKSHFDIIVVNDASTDKTKEILDLYSDDITLINNNKNLGLPSSLNIAIKQIKTPYFVALDDDKDLTITPIYYFDENHIFNTSYRQAFKNGFLNLETSYTKGYKRSCN